MFKKDSGFDTFATFHNNTYRYEKNLLVKILKTAYFACKNNYLTSNLVKKLISMPVKLKVI